MLLCIYIIILEVLAMDMVSSECVPGARVENENARLNGFGRLYCWVKNIRQSSQSFIYYQCDFNCENCRKMFGYSFVNDSVSFYESLNRTLVPSYKETYYFRITLRNVQVSDEGIWQVYIISAGSEAKCKNIRFTTYMRPQEKSRIMPFRENIPSYKTFNLTCQVNQIRPVYPLYFEINGLEIRDGIQIDTGNGITWNITYTVELVLSPIIALRGRCIIDYDKNWSLYDDWLYSDFVINSVEDNPLILHVSEEGVMGCAIPMGFSFKGWTKNNVSVSESHQFTETQNSEVRGYLDFMDSEVNTAQYSELRFVLPNLDQGCNAINTFSGVYACEALHPELGDSFKAPQRHVVVEYPPTLESIGASTYDMSTISEANVMIVCPLCSYPPVEKYKWLKGNIQLGNERTLMIPYVTERGFGKYICIATNKMGSANYTVNVIKIVSSKAKLYQGTLNEKVTLECPLCEDNSKKCTWQVNGAQIHDGRLYTFESLTEDDFGEYMCTAVYEGGRTWMRIALVTPGNTTTGSPTAETTTMGDTYMSTAVNMTVFARQKDPLLTTDVIAGFAVISTFVLGMIVAITVLSVMLIRQKRSRDDAPAELSTNATTSEETPHVYEKINVTFGNNPVYENTHRYQDSDHM